MPFHWNGQDYLLRSPDSYGIDCISEGNLVDWFVHVVSDPTGEPIFTREDVGQPVRLVRLLVEAYGKTANAINLSRKTRNSRNRAIGVGFLCKEFGYTPEQVLKMPLDHFQMLQEYLKHRSDEERKATAKSKSSRGRR